MTFGQYYIAQFKEIPHVWNIAKRFNKKRAFVGTVSLLLVPTYIYMMYLYDTGKMQVDTRYMKVKPKKTLQPLQKGNKTEFHAVLES